MDWEKIKQLDFEEIYLIVQEARAELLHEAFVKSRDLSEWARYLEEHPPSPETLAIALTLGLEQFQSIKGRTAANALHDKPGGSRAKVNEIREIWASGKYANRDRCAEEEGRHLGMAISTARKALRNTPDPT